MITLCVAVISVIVTLVVVVFRLLLYFILRIANQHKYYSDLRKDIEAEFDEAFREAEQQRALPGETEIPDEKFYILSQLEAWCDERDLSYAEIQRKETAMENTMNEDRKFKLRRQIVQMKKRIAANEQNIAKVCEKYNLDINDYLD